MAMKLVVMAAGIGSRFGGMKQVAKLGPSGEALFEYAVFDAVRSGFDGAVFVVSEKSRDAVRAHVEAGCGRQVDVRYVVQHHEGRPKPWGTGHAILTACAALEGPFGVVNADDFYGQRSYELLARELVADSRDHMLVAFRLKDSLSPNGGVSRGLCAVEDGFLTSVSELHDVQAVNGELGNREGIPITGDELISANLWGFRPSFCRVLGEEFDRFMAEEGDDPGAEFLVGTAVSQLGRYGDERVRVVPTPERFLGVTYPADVAAVQAEIAAQVDAGRYPSPLWS